MKEAGLGPHLDGNHTGELQVVELFLKAVAEVGHVVILLGILLGAGLGGLPAQLLQGGLPLFLELFLPGDDVHGQLFIVLGVQVVHLVEHGDVLHQGDLMALEHLGNFIHIGLGLGVAGLNFLQLVALLLEKTGDALLFRPVEALQLHHQAGERLAHFAQVLGAHAVERVFRKTGDILLGCRAVLEHHIRVGNVDLLGKVVDHLALGLGEHALVDLDGLDLLLLLGGGGILKGYAPRQRQIGGLGYFKAGHGSGSFSKGAVSGAGRVQGQLGG